MINLNNKNRLGHKYRDYWYKNDKHRLHFLQFVVRMFFYNVCNQIKFFKNEIILHYFFNVPSHVYSYILAALEKEFRFANHIISWSSVSYFKFTSYKYLRV